MNIIFIAYADLRGPGVIHTYHFASEIANMGHNVLFLMPGDMWTVDLVDRKPNFDVQKLSFGELFLSLPQVRMITDFKPDIVHIWTPRNIPARAGMEIKMRTGARLIIHYEDDEDYVYDYEFPKDRSFRLRYTFKTLRMLRPGEPWDNLWSWKNPLIYWIANRAASCFTALAPAIRDKFAKKWHKKAHLLYPGVDLKRFHPDVKPARVRERFGIPHKKLIVYSGAIARYHDFDLLLEALAKVAESDKDFCLLQVGSIEGLEEKTEALIEKLGIRANVVLGGRVHHKDIPGILAAGDVLVHPARNNDFNRYRLPSKIPEYLAMGKALVIPNVGIGSEFKDRVEVLKTYSDDPGELADRIRKLLNDRELRATLGKNARACAEKMFDLKKNAQELNRIYQETVGGRQ